MSKFKPTIKNENLISFVETPPEIVNLMIKLVNKQKDCNILDTGFGKGIFLKQLLENGFINIEGIEISKELFEYCESTLNGITLLNRDFLIWKPSKRYDLIIGNPPYAHYNSLPIKIQEEVLKITKTRESDIYYAFIIKSVELLKENGELIYIVPYGFLYNTHAKTVRKKLLENGSIQAIIDLDETRLFYDEHPETIIFKFTKVKPKNPENIEILRIKNRNARPSEIFQKAIVSLNKKIENELFIYHEKPQFNDYRDIWSTHPHIEIPEYIKLKDIAYIGVGLVTGFDLAFRIEDNEDKLFNFDERNLVFQFVKAANCKGFWVDGSVKYVLTDDRIKNENEISKKLPNIYQRILPHKEEMSNRYLPHNKKWFHWQALRNKTTIEKYMQYPKIFVPTLDRSKVNRFSLTNESVYPSGDVLCIIPLKIDPLFLLGYLNSDFFRKYYLSHGARRGHRIAFTQRILSNIKIPSFNGKIINEIIKITREILDSKDDSKRKLIDEVIEEAFEQKLFEKTGLYKFF
ncbi:MAG: SAM-dependent DNA methyltransferase [Candidatus Helarchaeota archaeon]|nr:SAM-dependent DNA methyltransferase [Candidatus Helarchaeota archaeon]